MAQVILQFESEEAKAEFIGGLLDGWGEGGPFNVDWDSGGQNPDGSCKIPADEADVLRVEVFEEDV